MRLQFTNRTAYVHNVVWHVAGLCTEVGISPSTAGLREYDDKPASDPQLAAAATRAVNPANQSFLALQKDMQPEEYIMAIKQVEVLFKELEDLEKKMKSRLEKLDEATKTAEMLAKRVQALQEADD